MICRVRVRGSPALSLAGAGIALALLLSVCAPVSAQYYYEKNKVQTRDYDFKTLPTVHFRIYYYQGGEELAAYAAGIAERVAE